MIRSLRPDILISDIQMPEMDGLTMLEQMKNELANSRVIFITAYDKIEYAARAIRLSAFDFLMKPVKNDDLIQSLDRAVQSMDRENSKIEKQAKEQTILRRARFLSALQPREAAGKPLKELLGNVRLPFGKRKQK